MFDPEDCIGIHATDYLLDLGFIVEVLHEYVGDVVLDDKILQNDGHPEHDEMLTEYVENLETRLGWYSGDQELIISWSSGEILSHSKSLSTKIIDTVKSFIDDQNAIYISDEKLLELENNNPTAIGDE
jgi:hypothetical protein